MINNETESIISSLNNSLWNEINTDYNILLQFSSYYSNSIPVDSALYPVYKQRFVNADNNTMISFLSLDVNNVEQTIINGFLDRLHAKLDGLEYNGDKFAMVELTGPLTMWNQGNVSVCFRMSNEFNDCFTFVSRNARD